MPTWAINKINSGFEHHDKINKLLKTKEEK